MDTHHSGNNRLYGNPNQFSHQGNYSGQQQQFNANLNNQQGQYGMNQQNHFDSGLMPTTPQGIREQIRKGPYTQTLDYEDLTYSLIPKKMKTMCMTHERFLLLKGIQIFGYARELPANQNLPFHSLADVPAPKTVIPLSGIDNVEVREERLIVIHADQEKTVWDFHCPTKKCAIEWHQKLMEAMDLLRQFQNSGFQSTAEFYRFKKGGGVSHFQTSPPPQFENRHIEAPKLDPTPPPRNFSNYHDDEVSRSIFNSGPKASPHQFSTFKSDTNTSDYYSPVIKPKQIYNEQNNQQVPQLDLGSKCSHCGSTIGSQRTYDLSHLNSSGRYPKDSEIGGRRLFLERGYSNEKLHNNMGNMNLGNFGSHNSNLNYQNNRHF